MKICVETLLKIHTHTHTHTRTYTHTHTHTHAHTHTHTHTHSLSSKEYVTEKEINKYLISFKNNKSPDNDELAK